MVAFSTLIKTSAVSHTPTTHLRLHRGVTCPVLIFRMPKLVELLECYGNVAGCAGWRGAMVSIWCGSQGGKPGGQGIT